MTADGDRHAIFWGDCQSTYVGSPRERSFCEQRRSKESIGEYHETDERDYNRNSVLE
jgi:hypothetical protein